MAAFRCDGQLASRPKPPQTLRMRRFLLSLALASLAVPAVAQPKVQTPAQALAEDAGQYAARFGVTQAEALRRLQAQQATVSDTAAIAREFESRLAGISIEHAPDYRIVVLLTGDEP